MSNAFTLGFTVLVLAAYVFCLIHGVVTIASDALGRTAWWRRSEFVTISLSITICTAVLLVLAPIAWLIGKAILFIL